MLIGYNCGAFYRVRAWLLLGTRLSARMRRLSQRMGRWRWLHTFIYSAQYVVITTVLFFPLTVYQGFVR